MKRSDGMEKEWREEALERNNGVRLSSRFYYLSKLQANLEDAKTRKWQVNAANSQSEKDRESE